MRCRRLKNVNGKQTVVWFGSYGVNFDGTAKFFNRNDKHDNFSTDKEAVVDSLIQRLSIIRQELWYSVTFGVALFLDETQVSKLVIDSSVIDIILSHPDVESIISFESVINQKHYSCNVSILSVFGVIDVNI